MYALSMYEEYLIDILKGSRLNDVRLYYTSIRGRIDLLKSKTNLIYGYIDLVSVDEISYDDYIYWHIGNNYTYNQALIDIEYNNKLGDKKIIKAYKYNFKNPILFNIPKKINILDRKGSWVLFDDSKIIDGYRQEKMF